MKTKTVRISDHVWWEVIFDGTIPLSVTKCETRWTSKSGPKPRIVETIIAEAMLADQ